MKKSLLVLFTIISFCLTSCTEDFTNPKNLVGTTWRCSSFPAEAGMSSFEYEELRFTSTTALEVWAKPQNASVEKFDNTYSYTIKDKTLTISYSGTSLVGTIDNKSMTFTQNGISIVFIKQ